MPFFMKRPGQNAGRVTDKPLRTSDIVPTIADALDLPIPWKIDGRSAQAATVKSQRRRRIISKRFRHTYPVDTPWYQRSREAALKRKLRLFGPDPSSFGPRPDLLGRRVAGLGTSVSSVRARLVGADRLRHVDAST